MNEIIVQKYGGTSVGTLERIKAVAEKINRVHKQGVDLVVVVSAMAGETDKLLSMAGTLTDKPERREIDLLLSSGERISSALLSMALHALGCPAIALTGRQIGMQTDAAHTKARITGIDVTLAKKYMKEGKVLVVAGFQGISDCGNVTTLGRGGSDTSAVALAVALKAKQCEILTDVDGVYTTDPNVVPNARKLDVVSFDEMLEMASLGAKVLQIRCVEFAKKYNMPMVVKSSFNDNATGTLICKENSDMEQPIVSGVMRDDKQAKITIKGVKDKPGIAAEIFNALGDAALSVDMIIQNISREGFTDISFTVASSDCEEAIEIVDKIKDSVGFENIDANRRISKVSIVGAGMRSHSGVAAKMFDTLSREKINILMISTSEIKVSCIIEQKHSKLAVQKLHEAFEMDVNPQSAATAKKAQKKSSKKAK
ncbi:MAG: aspartate kinase [Candidatus Nitrohelix vancouverensis]|uniref:Aspartokinase n=1 Tax=Candidatus Nitrohelix vancouverensis TaxID=2705534 RepID=A0A7T0BZT3_9BACT|nr:MAG: aspartate kinase [Candidatus Nitrohelix vancouverensis]